MKRDIVIKKAGKGSATVIMSSADYITEVRCQLNEEVNYSKLSDDPTEIFYGKLIVHQPNLKTAMENFSVPLLAGQGFFFSSGK